MFMKPDNHIIYSTNMVPSIRLEGITRLVLSCVTDVLVYDLPLPEHTQEANLAAVIGGSRL